MPTHYQDPALTCDTCGSTVQRPAPGAYRPLHEAGWRWCGNPGEHPTRLVPKTFLFSCPACPPVA